MDRFYDILLERALEAGFIKVSDLQPLNRSVSASSETLGYVSSHTLILQLIDAGKITQAQVDSIKKELELSLSSTVGELTGTEVEQSTDLADPARYELFELIGVGGMGQVYRARDKRLNRIVALKFINSHAKELINRFLLEAKVQARILHDNICRIYEVGEYNGRFYISMQYIDGQPLHRLQQDINIQQAVQIMASISEAIHSAHGYGFIHRDIKPSNIICEKLENGGYKPYLVDFGLAREVGVESKTLPGVIMGTPKYASPEQVRGDSSIIGVRSDVYSLGATLYALLTGCPPFSGSSFMEIVSKVVNEDPVPARRLNPAIPEDLETIVMKCLEKEPDRRYDSAQALAEDLRRFLSGDSIKAMRASIIYVVSRKARKHRAVVTVLAISLLLLMLAGGCWLRDRILAERLAQISQEFGRDVERIESIMRYSHLMPLHDTSAERAVAMAKMQQLRDSMNLLGSSATGPGNYALGKGYLVLGNSELARAHLELAWNSGYQTPDVAFALGQAYGLLYLNEADRVHSISEVNQNAARQRQSHLRDFALKYLRLSQIGNREQRSYTDALIAFYEKRYDDAVQFSRKSYSNHQWLYEALLLEGSIHTARASELIENKQYQDAKCLLDTAVKAFTEAARIGVSDENTYLSLARTFSMYMNINLQRRIAAQEELTAIESYCEKARRVNPASEAVRTLLYYAYMSYVRNASDAEKQHIIERLAEVVAPDYRLDRADAQERLFEYHYLLADWDIARGKKYLPNLELAEKYQKGY